MTVALSLYKNDSGYKRIKIGIKDLCEQGCLVVDKIRVPFPDCPTHGNPFK